MTNCSLLFAPRFEFESARLGQRSLQALCFYTRKTRKLDLKGPVKLIVKLFKMSGDRAAESCPTYAVVDKQKKKRVAEMDQENSADIALYAVVDKAKKKRVFSPDIHKNYDENEYLSAEVECTESQPTYSVLERDKTSEVVSSKNPSSNRFGDKDKKWKTAGSFSQLWLYLVIVIFAIVFLTLAFGISAGVSYSMISRLRADISSNKSDFRSFTK